MSHTVSYHSPIALLPEDERRIFVEAKATVYVTDQETGETRAHIMGRTIQGEWRDYSWSGPDSDYIWSEGNYSCDCNRALFFARAGNEPDAESWDPPCGEGRYAVRIEVDGRTVYQDEGTGGK